MPLGSYFKGKGEKVMAHMKEQYGEEKGKKVFYATANKKKGKKKGKKSSPKLDSAGQAKALAYGGR